MQSDPFGQCLHHCICTQMPQLVDRLDRRLQRCAEAVCKCVMVPKVVFSKRTSEYRLSQKGSKGNLQTFEKDNIPEEIG